MTHLFKPICYFWNIFFVMNRKNMQLTQKLKDYYLKIFDGKWFFNITLIVFVPNSFNFIHNFKNIGNHHQKRKIKEGGLLYTPFLILAKKPKEKNVRCCDVLVRNLFVLSD